MEPATARVVEGTIVGAAARGGSAPLRLPTRVTGGAVRYPVETQPVIQDVRGHLDEQPVRGAAHMHEVLGVAPDPAQDAEDGLDEEPAASEPAGCMCCRL